jgi:hypothetical protein
LHLVPRNVVVVVIIVDPTVEVVVGSVGVGRVTGRGAIAVGLQLLDAFLE